MIKETNWHQLPIGKIGKVVTGKTPPTAKPELFGNVYPFITPTDIDGVSRKITTERFLSDDGRKSQKNLLLPSKTICFVCIGATIGKMCLTDKLSFTNQQINSIIVNEESFDPLFVYYALKHISQNVKTLAGGAATPIINKTAFSDISISTPPLPIQRRIASILSAYDDLIENNTRRIAILEEMARRIYEEWFVKFKFPGHEKVKMVDSELGKIPEGWKVGYLSDILESIRYATRPGDHLSNRRYVPIDCIARKSLVLLEFKPWEEAQSSLVLFEEDDILFGAMRPYFHKVCIAPFPGITRTTCFVLRARDYYAHAFGVLTAFADATVSYASAHTQGATIPYAVWDGSLADYKVLIPTIELLKIFEETVSPMLNWLKRVTFKQTNLRTTRDFLLPKLISGEIDVSKLPEPEEAAA